MKPVVAAAFVAALGLSSTALFAQQHSIGGCPEGPPCRDKVDRPAPPQSRSVEIDSCEQGHDCQRRPAPQEQGRQQAPRGQTGSAGKSGSERRGRATNDAAQERATPGDRSEQQGMDGSGKGTRANQ